MQGPNPGEGIRLKIRQIFAARLLGICLIAGAGFLGSALGIFGCGRSHPAPGMVTMLIESSPANLDPRIGTDGQSEHIDALIFDPLVWRDKHFGVKPGLATRWTNPNPLTWIFHLRSGVRFSDGRPLTSRDVKWTIDSMLNGTVISVKAGSFTRVARIDTPNPSTVIFHLKTPDPSLLFDLCDGAFGVVPYGSGRNFWRHPIGSGPFEFVSQELDRDVVLRRNPNYWGTRPHIAQIDFAVVPDATTRALELEKGSADVESDALPADIVYALRRDRNLVVEEGPGTNLYYIVFNLHDPILHDVRVRRAIAMAINRPLIIESLYHGEARPASSTLPPEHWAWTGNTAHYSYDPAAAKALLDKAGYRRGPGGMRFHITMKTSDEEATRLLAVAVQAMLARVGIALDLRSYEFATFYADLTRGAFQMAPGRWIGGNATPDIFRYILASSSFPPNGANRGYYSNPEMDRLIADAAGSSNRQEQIADYHRIQQIAPRDLPDLNLLYRDTVVVHDHRLGHVQLDASGTFNFLRTATVTH